MSRACGLFGEFTFPATARCAAPSKLGSRNRRRATWPANCRAGSRWVKEALLDLVRHGRLTRLSLSSRYLYCSPEGTVQKRQWRQRQRLQARREVGDSLLSAGVLPEQLGTGLALFFDLLDEKQRRLYAGLESLKIGHGGDRRVAQALGLNAATVARGRHQLLTQDVPRQRIRRHGAGRKSVGKKPRKSSSKSNG